MQKTFSVALLLRNIGDQVTQQFDEAGLGTTGSIVGDAREEAVRRTLQRVLAGNNRVTSGVVIDSYENASRQTDIVIHEADICPVFTVGGADGSEYIPCEGVWGCRRSEIPIEDGRTSATYATIQCRYGKLPAARVSRGEPHRRRQCEFQGLRRGNGAQRDPGRGVRPGAQGIRSHIHVRSGVGSWDVSDSDATEEIRAFIGQNGPEMAPNMIIGIEKGLLMPARLEPCTMVSRARLDQGRQGIAVSRSVEDRWRKLVGILNLERTNRRTVAVNAFARYTTLSGGIKPFSSGIENPVGRTFHDYGTGLKGKSASMHCLSRPVQEPEMVDGIIEALRRVTRARLFDTERGFSRCAACQTSKPFWAARCPPRRSSNRSTRNALDLMASSYGPTSSSMCRH